MASPYSNYNDVVGIFYYQVSGLPGTFNAYHAGLYYSYVAPNADGDPVRYTVTWEAGPSIRDPGFAGVVEYAQEKMGIVNSTSPYGVLQGGAPGKPGEPGFVTGEPGDLAKIPLPENAIGGARIEEGIDLSGMRDTIQQSFDQLAKENYAYLPGLQNSNTWVATTTDQLGYNWNPNTSPFNPQQSFFNETGEAIRESARPDLSIRIFSSIRPGCLAPNTGCRTTKPARLTRPHRPLISWRLSRPVRLVPALLLAFPILKPTNIGR